MPRVEVKIIAVEWAEAIAVLIDIMAYWKITYKNGGKIITLEQEKDAEN